MTRLRAFDATPFRPADVADDAVVSVFRVPPEVAGQRLDVFVQSQLHRTSRTRAQTIVRASAYDANGRRLEAERPRAGRAAHPSLAPAVGRDAGAAGHPRPLRGRAPLAVDKPALLPVHPTARYHKNTLIKLLQGARPDCAFLSLGHRLDRETSGVILVSKTRACDRALKKQLANRDDIEKTYVAFTWGVPDRGDGATRFRYERSLELDPESPLRVKMRIQRRTRRALRLDDRRRRGGASRRSRTRVRARAVRARDGPAAPDPRAPGIARRARRRRQALRPRRPRLRPRRRRRAHGRRRRPGSSCPATPSTRRACRSHTRSPARRSPSRRRCRPTSSDFWDALALAARAPGHLVEIELIERHANERAAVGLRQAARLELVDEPVEPLEIAV